MKEIRYWVAEDGTKFDDEYECETYEKTQNLQGHKKEFVFLDDKKNPIKIDMNTRVSNIEYIIIKSDEGAKAVGEWLDYEGYLNPFDGVYEDCVGTWVYGSTPCMTDDWMKLELVIEQLQTLIKELNKGAE